MEKEEEESLKGSRGWRGPGAGAPLGGAREPQLAPPAGLSPSRCLCCETRRGGEAAFSPLCLSSRNKHPLPMEMQPGTTGIIPQRFVMKINRKTRAPQRRVRPRNVALNSDVCSGYYQLYLCMESCTGGWDPGQGIPGTTVRSHRGAEVGGTLFTSSHAISQSLRHFQRLLN